MQPATRCPPYLQAVDALAQHSDLARTDSVAAEAKALAERLAQAEKDAVLFNSREGLLGLPTTDYSSLRKLAETFEPYSQFWTTAAAWQVHALGTCGTVAGHLPQLLLYRPCCVKSSPTCFGSQSSL